VVLGEKHVYIWKTSTTWAGSCRKLVVTLVDGSTHAAVFRFLNKSHRSGDRDDWNDRDDRNDRDKHGRHDGKDKNGKSKSKHGK
jgi:rRNA processing protein Krr1/Pno1